MMPKLACILQEGHSKATIQRVNSERDKIELMGKYIGEFASGSPSAPAAQSLVHISV